MTLPDQKRAEIATWRGLADADFVEQVRNLRNAHASWFDDTVFQFQLRLELDLRLLGQVVKLRA